MQVMFGTMPATIEYIRAEPEGHATTLSTCLGREATLEEAKAKFQKCWDGLEGLGEEEEVS